MTSPLAVLVGPPGVGKSSVARILAARTGTAVRDTDQDIERLTGRTVSQIFAERGERHFRAIEHEAVRAALHEHSGVLALGGGAVVRAGTREALRGLPVVFLDATLADVRERLGDDDSRPLLRDDFGNRWLGLMATRRPLYLSVARAVVSTHGRTPGQVASAVQSELIGASVGALP
ncbi:shikimate kinase [Streptomyces sp. C11-1]|uniref:Shikimate kinase n=1 Tax=Streptomyces durocortorensis TaxID=2811104 RepID=A0ABY9VZL2_9ACTN|nr:shikimate kinase [Streptomyces durocortorensis]WNF29330.1 shikimate kinase [Streptomyces durocortorensis]